MKNVFVVEIRDTASGKVQYFASKRNNVSDIEIAQFYYRRKDAEYRVKALNDLKELFTSGSLDWYASQWGPLEFVIVEVELSVNIKR